MKDTGFHVVNIGLGSLITIDGLYWIVKIYSPFTPLSLWEMFSGFNPGPVDRFLVGFPVFTKILPILPISILLLGLFMLALDRRYPKITIPLWLMACGAFDVLGDTNPNIISRLIGAWQDPSGPSSFWPVFQLALMIGGYMLAGFPKFKANWWLALLIAVMVLTPGLDGDGRPFEIAVFAYIVTSTVPNLWGRSQSS